MARVRYKKLVPVNRTKKHLTKAEKAGRRQKVQADKQRRFYARMSTEERRERKKREDALLFEWSRVLPYVEKLESGCWAWRGPFRREDGRVRPVMRAGLFGRQYADFVVCCLAKGYPPLRCRVTRTCETMGCCAPDHLEWTVAVVERAKQRRQRHGKEELFRRQG